MSEPLSEEELEQIRGALSKWNRGGVCAVNHDSLVRLIATIDALKADLRAAVQGIKKAEAELEEALDRLGWAIDHAPYSVGDSDICPYCGNDNESGGDLVHKDDCRYGIAEAYARKHGRLGEE